MRNSLAVMLVVLSCVLFSNTSRGDAIKNPGITTINSTTNGRLISISILTVIIHNTANGNNLPKTSCVVRKLDITVDGKNIVVPLSVYADLLDPNSATIQIKDNKEMLLINGADTSESYFVRILFDENRVYKRELYSSLVPNQPTEETTYWIRTLEDTE